MEPHVLSLYILRALARHQIRERRVTLQTLVDELGVRRVDVRRTVSLLHEQGYLDVVRLHLSMAGFALGIGLLDRKLPELRRVASASEAA
jgi:DNA-binding IclR family transcriptional regulator